MSDEEIIVYGEEHGTEMEVRDAQPPARLFATDDPVEVIEQATRVANALRDVINKQNLVTRISGRDHVRVEGWTLLGSMLGVFPIIEWSKRIIVNNADGWEARVVVKTKEGAIVGSAEAECLNSESKWKGRDDFALRSMAQTRAVSKAMRMPLGFVMTLAGFDATPAEEMTADEPTTTTTTRPRSQPDAKPTPQQRKTFNDLVNSLTVIDRDRDWRGEVIDPWVMAQTGKRVDELTRAGYDTLIAKVDTLLDRARENASETPVPGPVLPEDAARAVAQVGMDVEQTALEPDAADAEADAIAEQVFSG